MSIKCITKTVCPASFACPMSQRWTSSAKTPSASPSRPSPCRSCGWGSKRSRCRSSAHAGCSAASGSASSVQSWSQTPQNQNLFVYGPSNWCWRTTSRFPPRTDCLLLTAPWSARPWAAAWTLPPPFRWRDSRSSTTWRSSTSRWEFRLCCCHLGRLS